MYTPLDAMACTSPRRSNAVLVELVVIVVVLSLLLVHHGLARSRSGDEPNDGP